MRPALAAVALALLCACAGYAPGEHYVSDGNEIPIGGNTTDGGHDAGPSDAGPDAGPSDAGCTALSLPTAGVIDGCLGGTGTASVNVNGTTCAVSITMTTSTGSCTGAASGVQDAFAGTCLSYGCNSTSLPGNVICTVPGGTSCTINICDAGTCP